MEGGDLAPIAGIKEENELNRRKPAPATEKSNGDERDGAFFISFSGGTEGRICCFRWDEKKEINRHSEFSSGYVESFHWVLTVQRGWFITATEELVPRFVDAAAARKSSLISRPQAPRKELAGGHL